MERALASAAAFLQNEAYRRPVAPELARRDAARIPNTLRQQWLTDAALLEELLQGLRAWPKNVHRLALFMGTPDRGPKTRYGLGSVTEVDPPIPDWDF